MHLYISKLTDPRKNSTSKRTKPRYEFILRC